MLKPTLESVSSVEQVSGHSSHLLQPPTAREALFRAAPMEMEAVVDCQEIPPEDSASEDWAEIQRKQRALSLKKAATTVNPNTVPEMISTNSHKRSTCPHQNCATTVRRS